MKPNAGKGYHWVPSNRYLKEGDSFENSYGFWIETGRVGRIAKKSYHYRRRKKKKPVLPPPAILAKKPRKTKRTRRAFWGIAQ